MIEFYMAPTPNGKKVSIMLEETGLPYRLHKVALRSGEQKGPEYLAINPNGKIPAIVDTDGPGGAEVPVFESGAILIYLAEKSGKLLSSDPRIRWETISWVMLQMSSVGPTFGELGHYLLGGVDVPYAIERHTKEQQRLLGVYESRLADRDYLTGEYSIADVIAFPWIHPLMLPANVTKFGDKLAPYPKVKAWLERIEARPAVQRGLKVGVAPA